MTSDKKAYRELTDSRKDIPLFSHPWWLDVVCGADNWDVVLYEKGGQIVGALPYYIKNKYGLPIITMPKLTQTMGPWIRYSSGQKEATRLSHEKEVFTALIDELPDIDYFVQSFHHSIQNWLPFYWMGFSQTTRYTYVLNDLDDLDQVWDSFDSRIRRMIRKAKKNEIQVDTTDNLEVLLELNQMTFERQGEPVPYSHDLVRRIDGACRSRDARSIYVARDGEGRPHSALFCVHGLNTTYYLLSGADPELRNSGANGLATWRSIQKASRRGNRYDFEGSMTESIERYFRDFGGSQTPYFQIRKMSRRVRVIDGLHGAVSAALGRKA